MKESFYNNLINDIDKELDKLSNIKHYIQSYDEIYDKSKDISFIDKEDKGILKVEDKPQYVPELVEAADIETELDLMNYEDEDENRDEFVFHVRINEGTDNEIIAKFFKDNEEDQWEVRVVKGDEEPLESMEFNEKFDKIEIISYLANIYDEIEIMDEKEYEYLLDDKEKIDKEYYTNLK
jgi:hypothetical protein